MYLSSKLVVFACLGTFAAAAPSLAAGRGLAPGMAHPVAPRVLHVGPGPGRIPGHRLRGYGYGYGLGYGGAGVSTYALDGAGVGAQAPVVVAEPPSIPPQPACPMIIKIGPGLDHPVQTRVIYGRPACD